MSGMNEIEEVLIRDDMIRLGQFIKLANLVEDGAQAREVIQNGLVKVNGDIEEARGKQLHDGDVVELNGFAARVTVEN
ncbi:RNA-binding S4 domain-containing protein [Mycobacteroides abscessus subsp. abscessus]|nr:RNA-binding S4 domain-containing protein [Mycobacteroides abscessus subsp. abscessus]